MVMLTINLSLREAWHLSQDGSNGAVRVPIVLRLPSVQFISTGRISMEYCETNWEPTVLHETNGWVYS